jgi:hypothetical protein
VVGLLFYLTYLNINLDVATERIPENDIPKFESILSRLFCMVFERATHERLGQSITRKALNLTRDVCQVEVKFEHKVNLIYLILDD